MVFYCSADNMRVSCPLSVISRWSPNTTSHVIYLFEKRHKEWILRKKGISDCLKSRISIYLSFYLTYVLQCSASLIPYRIVFWVFCDCSEHCIFHLPPRQKKWNGRDAPDDRERNVFWATSFGPRTPNTPSGTCISSATIAFRGQSPESPFLQ